jgi:hypothetical protein
MRPEIFEGDESDFPDRVIWVIKNLAGKPPRYKYLEERFGITARKWQNVCNKAQQPSVEMVACLSTVYPFFTSWMLTGKPKNFMQLSPTEGGWFKKMLDTMEISEQEPFLKEYADSLFDDATETDPLKRIQYERKDRD